MAVYDGFMFYNELDLLRVRLVEHAPFVDRFIVAEGDRTHAGQEKPFLFDIHDRRFAEFKDRIVHVKVRLTPPPVDPWVNERAQRDGILAAMPFSADDVILISDADEIISRHYWPRLLRSMQRQPALALYVRVAYYYVNLMTPERFVWPRCVRYGYLRERNLSPSDARWSAEIPTRPRSWRIPGTAGWHFSYLGDTAFITTKLASFAHQEYNTPQYATEQAIAAAVRARQDLFSRWGNRRFVAVPLTDRWPLEMLRNPFWKEHVCAPDPTWRRLYDALCYKTRRCVRDANKQCQRLFSGLGRAAEAK